MRVEEKAPAWCSYPGSFGTALRRRNPGNDGNGHDCTVSFVVATGIRVGYGWAVADLWAIDEGFPIQRSRAASSRKPRLRAECDPLWRRLAAATESIGAVSFDRMRPRWTDGYPKPVPETTTLCRVLRTEVRFDGAPCETPVVLGRTARPGSSTAELESRSSP